MASIVKAIRIDAPADLVWDALRDFGALHTRLVPGFVIDSEVRGDVRVITFFNGSVAHEQLVGIDDDVRRLAYTVVEGPLGATHHNAAAQVIGEPDGASRFLWITDVLPDELGAPMSGLMDRGLGVIKETLEAAAGRLVR
jgi:hypothetical protein